MLTPDELNILPKQVSDIYAKLEEFVIKQIAEQLRIAGAMNQKTINQIKSLQDYGFDIKRIDREIQKVTKLSDDELDNIYADAIRRTQEFTDKIVSKSDLIPPVPDRTFEIISSAIALERQTKEEFRNYTRSLGFAQDIGGKTVFKPIAKFYQDTLDFAQMQVQSGVLGYDEAVKNAVDTMVKSGLRTVDYKTGYTSKIEVAARRAVLTGISQYTAKETEMRMKDLDTDLVEVSAHQGARDKGTGFENHKKWQGKVYSFYGNHPKYPSLRRETGYGDIQGLKGVNCRHDFFPFIEGVSERTYTDEQLANIDPPPFEYEGKTYTAYEATQKQRQLETAMRNEKLKMVGYDAAGLKPEFTASAVKLRRLRKYYNDFSEKAGLKTQAERFRVTGYNREMSRKEKDELKSYKDSKVVLQSNGESGTIISQNHSGAVDVHKIGKIDKKIYQCVTNDIATDDVVITDKQIAHIKERHPNDYERYFKYMEEIIQNPDYILEANKPATAFILKHIKDNGKNYQLIMRLKTSVDPDDYKNSVITFLKVEDKRYKRYLRTKKILYKSE